MLNCGLINSLIDSLGLTPVLNALFSAYAGVAGRGVIRSAVEACAAL